MERIGRSWALVLAAGEGTRLRALTTDIEGRSIPKQYCTLSGRPTLLRSALRRANRVVSVERILTIVAAQHESWWRGDLDALPEPNIIVQPSNRGTAIGILLPLLCVLQRDPHARIVILPSDHFVADEKALARAMGDAVAEVAGDPRGIALLGIVPDEPDPELGWIVPAAAGVRGGRRVERFVEKPPPALAAELMRDGAVWNSFILAAEGRSLLELFENRLADVVDALRSTLLRSASGPQQAEALAEVYRDLPTADFSRDILEGREERLRVVPVPRCRWSDLGTPARVARCVRQLGQAGAAWAGTLAGGLARPDLARVPVAPAPSSTSA